MPPGRANSGSLKKWSIPKPMGTLLIAMASIFLLKIDRAWIAACCMLWCIALPTTVREERSLPDTAKHYDCLSSLSA